MLSCHMIVEVEMILNSRPLSYVSSDDTGEPLTGEPLMSFHLIMGREVMNLSDSEWPCLSRQWGWMLDFLFDFAY